MSAWMTRRTSGLSMPMPKALVAQIARRSPRMKLSWTFFLVSGGSPAWKVVGGHPLLLQELRHLFRMAPGRAVDDGPARSVRRQVRLENLVNVIELCRAAGGDHHEIQVGAPGAAVEDLHVNAQLVMEVLDDLVLHVGLGGGGEAQDGRRRLIPGLLPDEASYVAVVGPEVVSPPGEAVGLVQHPGADLPLVQCPPQGDAAQLFRRDQQDAGVAQPHPLQGVGPFRHGQQAVDGDAGTDPPGFQSDHLVGHEGHQR